MPNCIYLVKSKNYIILLITNVKYIATLKKSLKSSYMLKISYHYLKYYMKLPLHVY